MEINEKNLCLAGMIANNSYTLTIIDKDGNVISEETKHNIALSKKYFSNNAYGLNIALGIMTDNDKRKYVDSDGNWLPGCAAHAAGGGGFYTNSKGSGKIASASSDSGWYFKKEPSENDTGLFGTTVLSAGLSWKCVSIGSSNVVMQAEHTWGFHSPADSNNQLSLASNAAKGSLNGDDIAVEDSGVVKTWSTYDFKGNVTGTTIIDEKPKIRGYCFTDGGLFFGPWGGTLYSHFTIGQSVKRPTDYLKISVTVSFARIPTNYFNCFMKEGCAAFAHSVNGSNYGTSCFKPDRISFSGLPLQMGEGGTVPIPGGPVSFSLREVGTDTPNDWNASKKGTWFGFPHYRYFGSGQIYQVEKYVDKDGKTKEKYKLDKKERKQFNWQKLKEAGVVGLNGSSLGPVRSIIMDGFGATTANGLPVPQPVTYLRIGTGDGVTKKFYHSR